MDESSEPNILYELLIHNEWVQDPEILVKGVNDKPRYRQNSEGLIQWLGPLGSSSCPPACIQNLVNQQLPWHFAVGGEGKVIAVLQEHSLEIRSSRDEYGSVLGRSFVERDPDPQWRKLVWSPDCTMVAIGQSNGNIDVYDLIGAHLFTINNDKNNGKSNDLSEAIAGMLFCDLRVQNAQWSYELLVATYKGRVSAYFVSPTDGYKESHDFSVLSYYPNGISALSYHHASQLLLICGRSPRINFPGESGNSTSLQFGLTAWRILHGPPYYKLVLSLEDETALQQSYWWKMVPAYWKDKTSPAQDIIYRMSVSPNENILAAIHVSGALSLWDLPSLRLRKLWELDLQPNYQDLNPQYCEPGMKRKAAALFSNPLRFHLCDANWWAEDAIILARSSGAVSVSSIHSLKNLLGVSPEWFEPYVQLSASHDRGFLAMECESVVTSRKRSSSDVYDENDGEESCDEDDISFFTKATEMAKTAMFYVTDFERFRPPRKKIKYMNKTYRLLCLKSTTPEELFIRKINNEEYGEALALAKTYQLDCDLVYQRQWRKMPASVLTIQDYLSKITKRSWVLHECLERVPETIEAAKELLLYGLRGTDLHALIAIGKGEDHGRFIVSPLFDDDDEEETLADGSLDDYYATSEEVERRKQEIKQKRAAMLKKINFSKLTLEQKQLCDCRLKLLSYLDRLTTYEAILGGPGIAEEFYDHNFFKKFRCQSGLEACISFAHNSNWQAIAAMFTYHGKETLQHRLPVLSNFPETTSPVEYQLLLPKLGYSDTGPFVCPWNEDQWRIADWCEIKYIKPIYTPASEDFIMEFYEDNKEFLKYRDVQASSLLTEWFIERAHEIESKSFLVDNALELVKLGLERNIQGLERLLDHLKTLEVLTYDCMLEKDISLSALEEMDDYEVIQLLMSKSAENVFMRHVNQWLLPFLDRCEKHKPGSKRSLLRRYLVDVSKSNLKFCRKLFENSRREHTEFSVSELEDQMSVALDCIYICERTDCLKDVRIIMEQLLHQNSRSLSSKGMKLQAEIKELEKHVKIAEILEKQGCLVTLGFIRTCSLNSEEIKKLLTKVTRLAGRRHPSLSEKDWETMLSDILEIQHLLSHGISVQECYEIFLLSLLCSGKQDTINLAGRIMDCNHQLNRRRAISEQRSFKLPHSSSVDLVLKASQEHFNSSASPSDNCMSLAWSCLKLIDNATSSIEEEMDLISSLKLLQEFNVNILPLQVRLCSDRLKLVEKALNSKSKAYRNSSKLLKLAYLLRVCGDNKKEREGKVLSLIAEAAFKENDFEPCLKACSQLMEGNHEVGWQVCHDLGKCKDFTNVEARCELLSFSLIHCSSDLLENILKAKAELQLQMICDRLKFLMGDNFNLPAMEADAADLSSEENSSSSSGEMLTPEESINTLWQTREKTLQVLQTTTKTTKAVLTAVRGATFWKDAVKWIKSNDDMDDDNFTGQGLKNKDLKMQGVCAFYSGLIENSHASEYETNYQKYARPDLTQSVEIASKIFRATVLEDYMKSETSKSVMDASAVLDLSREYLSEDMMLSLSLLLTVDQLDEVDCLFKKLPSSPFVLQFASLFFALKLCSVLDIGGTDVGCETSYSDPTEIIRQVEDYLDSSKASSEKNTAEAQKAFNLLTKYSKMLYDYLQAEILHSVGGGVDAIRFAEDDVYKKETILGIAMTMDDSVFQTAVSLAHHYKLPLWDVYMAHLEYLFSESRISASAIESRIESTKLLEVLCTDAQSFRQKLISSVYPSIDGKDHSRLLLYFTLLEASGNDPDSSGLKPSVHKQLITKFKSVVKGLDYKQLMRPGVSPLNYIAPLLNESSVHVFAKSAHKIPDENGGFLDRSSVYCLWAIRYFFDGSGSLRKAPNTMSEWLHRYEACNDLIQRLNPNDVAKFVSSIVFSEKALKKLSVDCRAELVKRALKFCKQKLSAKTKEDPDSGLEWSNAVDMLTRFRQHLQRMDDPLLSELKSMSDEKVSSYISEFDLSQSIPEKLKDLLTKVVLEGPDLSLLKTLLSCCPAEVGWEPTDAYIEAIRLVIERMKGNSNSYFPSNLQNQSLLSVLERILKDISENKNDLMIDDVAVDTLCEFCQGHDVPVELRLEVLKLLEKTNYLSEEYSHLLLLFQTQAVVASIWPDYEVTEDAVSNEQQRRDLFQKLLNSASTIEQFCSLAELLCHWPVFSESSVESGNEDSWTQVLCKLSSFSETKALDKAIYFLDKAHSNVLLSQQSCWKIFHEISKQGSVLHTLKLAFKTVYDDLHSKAINILKQVPEDTSIKLDEELINLILEKHLTVQIVSTSLYKNVIEYMLNQQDDHETRGQFSVESVAEELAEAGYKAEAGSLLLLHSRTHSGLSTYSSAFNILAKWLTKPK